MNHTKEALQGVNWPLLREQKEYCINEANNNSECSEIYDGIVHLIDALQDAVVADGIVSEYEVFGESGDEDLTAEQLDAKYNPDGDGEHPSWPREEWQGAAYEGNTLLGYWQWVEMKIWESAND